MKKFFVKLYPFLFFILFAKPVFADEPLRITPSIIDNLVNTIIEKLFPFAGLLTFFFIVYGGYMWMMSGGDPAKVKQAQGTLTWAIIGLIFVILVNLILRAILKTVE